MYDWTAITPNPRHEAEYLRISDHIDNIWKARDATIDYNLAMDREFDHDYLNELVAAVELLAAHMDGLFLTEFIPLHVRLGFEYTPLLYKANAVTGTQIPFYIDSDCIAIWHHFENGACVNCGMTLDFCKDNSMERDYVE